MEEKGINYIDFSELKDGNTEGNQMTEDHLIGDQPHTVESSKDETRKVKGRPRKSVKGVRESVKSKPKVPKDKHTELKEEDSKVSNLRNELNLLILNHAEVIQMSEPELKKELTKAMRIKEN